MVHLIAKASDAVSLDRLEQAEQKGEKKNLFHADHGVLLSKPRDGLSP
jgi:hypothetical protein